MIKESKYILRKILIGVGIFITLSFIKSCNVKAFESIESSRGYNYYINNTDFTYLTTNNYLFYNQSRTNYYFYDNNKNLVVSLDNGSFTNINDDRLSEVKNFVIVKNMQDDYNNGLIFINEPDKLYFQNNTLKYQASSGNYYFDGLKVFGPDPAIIYPSVFAGNGSYVQNYSFKSNYTNEDIIFSTFDIYDNNDNLIHSSDLSSIPKFISFNANSIHNDENVITGYTLEPEFSLFDTENYSYQYSFDTKRWLILTENEQLLNVNINSTIYVRIKDKNNNEVIENATFTITNIGTFYNEQSYDITFSGEYKTENYLNNTIVSKSQSLIKEYSIYIDYIPKTSILTYQYQFVPNNSSLDNNNWQNVPESDEGSITYVANTNGVLYARILDNDGNVLKTATFTVNSIGLFAMDNNESKIDDFYSKLGNKVNFTGPISSLVNIPIQLINTISEGLTNNNVCVDYSLGSLWGTNLFLPCVNIRHHLGNSLYNTIDLIIACCMIYYIIRMFGNLYTNLLFMSENPIKDLGRRGD